MADEYLKRTPTSTGNRRVFTLSCWIKQNQNGNQYVMGAFPLGNNASNQMDITLSNSNNNAEIFQNTSGVTEVNATTTAKHRDNSSWINLIVSVNTTLDTSTDRIKIYINGILDQLSSSATLPSKNFQFNLNNTIETWIGNWPGLSTDINSQLTDVFLVDGQALTPDVFGKYIKGNGYISAGSTQATDFRKGQWVPKAPRVIKSVINARGGFGVNGFYLPMNSSTNFGADFHCDPNSIIKLNEELAQPKVGIATTATASIGYTDALRADPYAANLVLALPFVSSGLCTNGTNVGVNTGFGDYSHIIRNSGVAKTVGLGGTVSIATVGVGTSAALYYGSSALFNGGNSSGISVSGISQFTGDFTIEMWMYPRTTAFPSAGNLFGDYGTGQTSGMQLAYYNSALTFYANGNYVIQNVGAPQANQWNHVALSRKASNLSMYLNGVVVGINTISTATYGIANSLKYIGVDYPGSIEPFNGFIQDVRVYNGVAKYTGGFDVPKPYTPVGISTWRAVPDTCQNNFATMNPLIEARPSSGNNSPSNSTIVTFADGNLNLSNAASSGNAQRMVSFATIGISTGKWYYEEIPSSNSRVGLSKGFQQLNYTGTLGSGSGLEAGVTYGASGVIGIANSAYYNTATTLTPPSFNNTNIIGVSIDASLGENNLTVRFYKDGVGVSTLTGVGATSPVREWFPTKTLESSGSGDQRYFNFGQNPTFSGNTTAGTFTDSNGKGLFKYQPPSGFLALCEDNLPTPAISNPGEHFKTVLYTGTGASRSIVGVGFTPDLIWTKSRTSVAAHWIVDSVRGSFRGLQSHTTDADTITTDDNLSFGVDGFSLGASSNNYTNQSGTNYVAWCWRAGAGTTSTNTDGSITSVVSVNQTAGFSIVSYTGNGGSSAVTVGHRLGKVPSLIICKGRQFASNWITWHKSLNGGNVGDYYLRLNSTDGQSNAGSSAWNNTSPTSTVFTVGASSNTNGSTPMIAYCWAEIEGFSRFGSYIGNGNADGPFVYCGFKPAFVLIKNASASSGWALRDSSRGSVNPNVGELGANVTDIEASPGQALDFLSNGFKLRTTDVWYNTSGNTFIFAAFAESPINYSNAK